MYNVKKSGMGDASQLVAMGNFFQWAAFLIGGAFIASAFMRLKK